MNKSYGNGSKSDVERFLLNQVPGVTAFRIEEYGKGIVSVFVDGGLESDIAEALYQTMSAGIVMSGDISCTVNGTNIKFSRGAAPCDKKWEVSCSYKIGDKVRAPGTFERIPEEEYQKSGGPVVNPTLRFFSEVCSILGVTPTGAQKEKLYRCLEDRVTPMYTMKISAGNDAALKERIKGMETGRSTARTLWNSEYSQQPSFELSPDEVAWLDGHAKKANTPTRISDYVNIKITKIPIAASFGGPAVLLKYPEDETFDDKLMNMTGPTMGVSELRASYPEEDARAPLNSLVQSRAADQVLAAGTFQKIDEKVLSDLAEEMADYKEEPEGLALNPLWRTWYKQWRQTNNSQYKADPLSTGYGQQVPTSTTNETNLSFPLPTAPAIPGTVIWGDSPLVLSGEALRAWGVALDNADYAAPEIKEDVERLPASPGWAPTDAFPPTKSPTTMYVCLSYGCPERAPSPSHEICYTCGKPMSGVMVEEKSDVITLNITCPAVSVSGPAPAGTTEHFVGATDSNVVTYFPGSVAYCDSI